MSRAAVALVAGLGALALTAGGSPASSPGTSPGTDGAVARTATPAAAQAVGCGSFAAAERDFSQVTAEAAESCHAEPITPQAFPQAPRTLRVFDLDANVGDRSWSMWATYGGKLNFIKIVRDFTTQPPVDTISATSYGQGWDGIRVILAGGTTYLYGLHDNGRLYRYRIVNPAPGQDRRIVSAGSVAGFGGVKGIDILQLRQDRTEFLVTTTAGTLSVVRVPTTTTMAATSTQLRSRTWQGTDTLLVSPAYGLPTTGLSGINRTTGKWTRYQVGDTSRGLATPISTVQTQPIDPALSPALSGLIYPLDGQP